MELAVVADRHAELPLTEQIAAQLRDVLSGGRLAAGERLPSTRALAVALGVSRTVVTAAYTQLFAEGWLEGRHGSGTYVAPGAIAPLRAGPAPAATAPPSRPVAAAAAARPAGSRTVGLGTVGPQPEPVPSVNLRPGIPWQAGIDPAAWRRAWRHAGTEPVSAQPDPRGPDPRGHSALREALTGYLRRGRGVCAAADQILVTRGVSAGLGLVAAALLRPGDRVGVEEPGYQAARAVFASRGARLVPCRVDGDGLVVDELPDDLRLVYTTPAHQYPLGGRLPVPRRQALAAWARSTGALIVEDDYDGEFRYDVAPLPTLFGLDPDLVIYLGTTSKTLTPALGAGWLVARPDLLPAFTAAAVNLGERVSGPVQHAVTELLASGELERHVRRMRHEYARRRAVMVTALAGRLSGDTAGMHMVLELPPGTATAVARAARERGVEVATLDRYFGGPPTLEGLMLGYGAADLAAVSRGCQVIAEILSGLPGTRGAAPR
ncbi:MAG TPA: PLP-dependent aminotransferase family protein [Streptosporangiaceae bacterium]|nr:PLP-dependent aminotransferase family protein [Streptosporangiaceae bacterium]